MLAPKRAVATSHDRYLCVGYGPQEDKKLERCRELLRYTPVDSTHNEVLRYFKVPENLTVMDLHNTLWGAQLFAQGASNDRLVFGAMPHLLEEHKSEDTCVHEFLCGVQLARLRDPLIPIPKCFVLGGKRLATFAARHFVYLAAGDAAVDVPSCLQLIKQALSIAPMYICYLSAIVAVFHRVGHKTGNMELTNDLRGLPDMANDGIQVMLRLPHLNTIVALAIDDEQPLIPENVLARATMDPKTRTQVLKHVPLKTILVVPLPEGKGWRPFNCRVDTEAHLVPPEHVAPLTLHFNCVPGYATTHRLSILRTKISFAVMPDYPTLGDPYLLQRHQTRLINICKQAQGVLGTLKSKSIKVCVKSNTSITSATSVTLAVHDIPDLDMRRQDVAARIIDLVCKHAMGESNMGDAITVLAIFPGDTLAE